MAGAVNAVGVLHGEGAADDSHPEAGGGVLQELQGRLRRIRRPVVQAVERIAGSPELGQEGGLRASGGGLVEKSLGAHDVLLGLA